MSHPTKVVLRQGAPVIVDSMRLDEDGLAASGEYRPAVEADVAAQG